jgi:ubiquinone/menaquinone biosynthesis C-methylase UbiE
MTIAHKSAFDSGFNENNQEFMISGKLRPQSEADLDRLLQEIQSAAARVRGTFYLNVKRLAHINNIAFRVVSRAIAEVSSRHPELQIVIVTSSVLGWSTRKFSAIAQHLGNVSVAEYDKDFYPGQSFLEDGGFIPILRNQTRLTWRHERNLLSRHGLRPGMDVADICCGIGDFAVLLNREFKPARLLALDHSRSSLDYARKVAADFGMTDIDYVHGDASGIMIEDNSFDFVTCRHSLQIFDKPELIVKELYRICKPGGRVYVTNEKISQCMGEPRGESIAATYAEVAELFANFKMDLEFGPKSRRCLMDAGFADIRIDTFTVANTDGDPREFADMVEAWEDVFINEMARDRGDTPERVALMRRGLQDHIHAALHPYGYAGWPIWAASGQKPSK